MILACIALVLWPSFVNADPSEDDQCNSAGRSPEYSTPLHVAAIFIIFAASALGVGLPVSSKFIPLLRLSPRIVTCGKSFGVGVILATAFIHMLPPSIEKLTSPCLGAVWSDNYTAFAPLFSMVAVLAMHLFEYLASTHMEKRLCHKGSSQGASTETETIRSHHCARRTSEYSERTEVDESAVSERIYVNGNDMAEPKDMASYQHVHTLQLETLRDSRRWISTLVLEVGILAHSVIVGITLGVSDRKEFVGLLIALCFHQFFEGFALGARIVEVNLIRLKSALVMALSFSATTPIGVVIGIGVSASYNPNSNAALLAQGIFDALSGGILIYVSLVNLLASEMLFDERFKKLHRGTRIASFIFIYLGAGVMGLIGLWA